MGLTICSSGFNVRCKDKRACYVTFKLIYRSADTEMDYFGRNKITGSALIISTIGWAITIIGAVLTEETSWYISAGVSSFLVIFQTILWSMYECLWNSTTKIQVGRHNAEACPA